MLGSAAGSRSMFFTPIAQTPRAVVSDSGPLLCPICINQRFLKQPIRVSRDIGVASTENGTAAASSPEIDSFKKLISSLLLRMTNTELHKLSSIKLQFSSLELNVQ